ncbi:MULTISPECIES: biliverdin-producing heme oxygenase [Pseudomonas]|uniref:Heme oxygenase n=1 Tax=Pseudomonas putida NBRC 14164 TaxID=1211579 RepID=A0ABM7EHF5_PSEPU|nr:MULTISPECIES: biliverdin-producing heme oxygenase [Pseudomonas]EKT4463751.1 biliverdin-producing heme oxygenase [Pseudomonas putida]EKT4555883.1 biliverdin-producing heme oxygenase [Pseudomonas putida]ELF6206132.1 biliverdin-producing heme oxygenase [Pseudomonas putida]MCX9139065.1 biliverdin-producing heme oxygenase [Pseudomonas sp. DCB_PUT]MDD1973478.1 biliverdin-producing heme oxygenase [Pseudomonas putida]
MTAAPLPLTAPGRCKRLKAASSSDHDKVDELVMAARPFESRERYGHFLQVQHRFHGSLLALYQDEQLNRWLPGLVELSRFAAVEEDLLDLGLPLPTPPQPVSASPAQALGWLYCSEGSNLGAAFLFKQTQRLGLNGNEGARHLAPHPDGRALHWREFVARLDGLVLDEEEEAEVVTGAIAAFDSYRAHLREVFAGR